MWISNSELSEVTRLLTIESLYIGLYLMADSDIEDDEHTKKYIKIVLVGKPCLLQARAALESRT